MPGADGKESQLPVTRKPQTSYRKAERRINAFDRPSVEREITAEKTEELDCR
jgi:hypothetical protein